MEGEEEVVVVEVGRVFQMASRARLKTANPGGQKRHGLGRESIVEGSSTTVSSGG